MKMKTLLISDDLWKYVEDGFVEPNNVEGLTNAWKQQVKEKKRETKALSKIQQGVPDSIFSRITNETREKDAWEILKRSLEMTLR